MGDEAFDHAAIARGVRVDPVGKVAGGRKTG
jgi:hypothetical protein